MRRITHISTLALAAAMAAGTAGADVFPTDSAVTAATLYPQGATLLREASFDLPAGRHSIVLTDMPLIDIDSLRLQAEGLVIGSISYRDRAVPPSGAEEAPEIAAARQAVRDVEAELQAVEDRARAAELAGEAARDRIDFLTRLGGTEAAGSADAERLTELLDLVGGESLKAREAAQAAEQQARAIREERRPLEEDLKQAQAALAALLTASEEQSVLVIEVEAPEAASGGLTLSYASWQASWRPAYDAYLTTGDSPALELARGAYMQQSTGEDWQDVAVTFSTARPSGQIAPGFLTGDRLSIFDPDEMPRPLPQPSFMARSEGADMAQMAEPVMEEKATAGFDGINVTYTAPQPVSVANGADAVKIALGRVDFTPEVFARAVPLRDDSAFLVAGLTNDSGELLLPGVAQLFRDGTYVGRSQIDLTPVDEDTEWSFGPIDGLRLSRLQDRLDGDRGVITRSNTRQEAATLRVENRTGQAWDLRLLDRVPYSEQEDLTIEWSADLEPTVVDFDDRKGVLEWQFTLEAGAEQDIRLEHEVTWPDGKVLR